MGSYFGDHTVQQEIMDTATFLMEQHNLSKEDMAIVLISVFQAILDPYAHRLQEIRDADRLRIYDAKEGQHGT
jgi:hypothetical protein